jgi:hypothetical protein
MARTERESNQALVGNVSPHQSSSLVLRVERLAPG